MKKETILDKLYTLRDLVVEVKEVLKDLSSDIAQNSQDVEPFYRKLDEMIEKVDRSINNINKEKIAMALFGAFSDGKSSVVSAITKNFNIRIAPEPTTDRVTFYEYENFFIVDTPGTFSHNNLHDEETRKYISEANVILFVVDAVNPIKDSHKDLVKGVLIDMKKLENTIFVLNKMDSVVMDLEDEEEYKEKTEIKKKALLDMLDYLNLSGEDKEKIRVVAVSA
ncbi:MAG: dynamin family protein, partial [Candidatus Kryptonium sp.]